MNSDRIRKMRLPMEIKQLDLSFQNHGIKCSPTTENPENYDNLIALLPGPKGTPYEDVVFKISISCGDQYPFRPPTFKFLTPNLYHPNIDSSGKICLDLLRMPPTGTYNPAITLESILLSIQLLLANPNPDDPLNGDAADLYKTNIALFNEKARAWSTRFNDKPVVAENGDSTQSNDIQDKSGHGNELKKRLRLGSQRNM
ncbi:ubiquitin-conjugating enzyme E2 N-like [Haematobia irritans]|uniref:ubiquitin-conjugating enzyme E2 N-like n=1 Tax=Haematobia irritans TaxID=7368 RepID=UPI003F50C4F5